MTFHWPKRRRGNRASTVLAIDPLAPAARSLGSVVSPRSRGLARPLQICNLLNWGLREQSVVRSGALPRIGKDRQECRLRAPRWPTYAFKSSAAYERPPLSANVHPCLENTKFGRA